MSNDKNFEQIDEQLLAAAKAKPDFLRSDEENELIERAARLEEEQMMSGSTIFAANGEGGKQSRLTPRKKGVIAISAAALLTAVAVAVVSFLLPNDGDAGTSSYNKMIEVLTVDQATVESIEVTNQSSSYTVCPAEEGSQYEWVAEGYEDINLSGLSSVVDAACDLSALKKMADSDEDIYKLAEPMATVKVKTDSKDYTVTVGGYSPDQSGCYVTVSGTDGVYLMDKYDVVAFIYSVESMIDSLSSDAFVPADNEDEYFTDGTVAMIDRLILDGTCRDDRIVIENPPEDIKVMTYLVVEPTYQAANIDNVDVVLNAFTSGMYNDGAFVLKASDADMKQYGLDKPYSTVYCKVNKNTISLAFGKPVDGYYPFTVNDGKTIYKLAVDGNEWVEYQPADLFYESLYIENINTLSNVTLTFEGKQYSFNLTSGEDEEGTLTFECVRADGVEIKGDMFKRLYERIISLSGLETADDARPDGEPTLTITLKHTDEGKADDVITLYKYSARRYYYQLNGKGSSLVSVTDVDDIMDNTVKLWNGEDITSRTQK